MNCIDAYYPYDLGGGDRAHVAPGREGQAGKVHLDLRLVPRPSNTRACLDLTPNAAHALALALTRAADAARGMQP